MLAIALQKQFKTKRQTAVKLEAKNDDCIPSANICSFVAFENPKSGQMLLARLRWQCYLAAHSAAQRGAA
jgi:hypothetical protein